MKTLIMLLIVAASMLVALPANAQSDDCDDYCQSSDLDCQSYWHSIHQNYHYDGCQNYDQYHTLEGWCYIDWSFGNLNLGYTQIDCFGGKCTITGSVFCGGTAKPYSLQCTTTRNATGDGEVPRARGWQDGARCAGDDAGFSVACNGSTGQLVYSIFAP